MDCAFSLCIALHLDLPKTRRVMAVKHNCCYILVFYFQSIWSPPEWNFCSMRAKILVACECVCGVVMAKMCWDSIDREVMNLAEGSMLLRYFS